MNGRNREAYLCRSGVDDMLAGSSRRSRTMTQEELKKAVAKAAIAHVPEDCVVGVGTGSTANFFIDELARIKGRLEGAVASSEASAARLKEIGRASCRERV